MSFKPMKGDPVDLEKYVIPPGGVFVSPKIDGVRGLIMNGTVLSSTLKPMPNHYLQVLFRGREYEGLDGELVVDEPNAKHVLHHTKSHVMSSLKAGYRVRLFAFDTTTNPGWPYHRRMPQNTQRPHVEIIPQHHVYTMKELLDIEQAYLDAGYEGVMLRDPQGPYKFGRSTMREGYLLKLKRFADAEFEIVGFEERMHNGNEATTNELGRTKRSSAKAGKTGRGDLGALILKNTFGPGTFNVGTGFSDKQRAEFWEKRHELLGQFAKVKYFTKGMIDTPLLPTFLDIRSEFE
jgi:DNA ligase-1